MALTRGELKALVKELIVEVLSEGLGSVQAPARPQAFNRSSIQGSVREGKVHSRRPTGGRSAFDPALDTPISKNAVIKEQIKANAGGNPIMQAILADTANTTLRALSGDRSLGSAALEEASGGGGKGSIQQVEQINGTPEEVFGEETAGRWASLAFAEPKKTA